MRVGGRVGLSTAGEHLKNKPELLCFFLCCPTDILHYLIQNTIFSDSNFSFCMLMFKKSPGPSTSTIIRYPQREIEKLITLWVFLYLSGPTAPLLLFCHLLIA